MALLCSLSSVAKRSVAKAAARSRTYESASLQVGRSEREGRKKKKKRKDDNVLRLYVRIKRSLMFSKTYRIVDAIALSLQLFVLCIRYITVHDLFIA